MRVALACDHAGFLIKEAVKEAIIQSGNDFLDLGTNDLKSVDFPDYAEKAAHELLSGNVERSVVICGSGIGMCISSNKIKGIYAAVCSDSYSARQGVNDDHMNTLCLGGRVIGPELAAEVVKAFLGSKPSLDERFTRRVKKIKNIEGKFGGK